MRKRIKGNLLYLAHLSVEPNFGQRSFSMIGQRSYRVDGQSIIQKLVRRATDEGFVGDFRYRCHNDWNIKKVKDGKIYSAIYYPVYDSSIGSHFLSWEDFIGLGKPRAIYANEIIAINPNQKVIEKVIREERNMIRRCRD